MGILGGVYGLGRLLCGIVLRNLASSLLDYSIRELVGIARTYFA